MSIPIIDQTQIELVININCDVKEQNTKCEAILKVSHSKNCKDIEPDCRSQFNDRTCKQSPNEKNMVRAPRKDSINWDLDFELPDDSSEDAERICNKIDFQNKTSIINPFIRSETLAIHPQTNELTHEMPTQNSPRTINQTEMNAQRECLNIFLRQVTEAGSKRRLIPKLLNQECESRPSILQVDESSNYRQNLSKTSSTSSQFCNEAQRNRFGKQKMEDEDDQENIAYSFQHINENTIKKSEVFDNSFNSNDANMNQNYEINSHCENLPNQFGKKLGVNNNWGPINNNLTIQSCRHIHTDNHKPTSNQYRKNFDNMNLNNQFKELVRPRNPR